jgi:stearoyl-CoA desaturase (delta-9 desaturase)
LTNATAKEFLSLQIRQTGMVESKKGLQFVELKQFSHHPPFFFMNPSPSAAARPFLARVAHGIWIALRQAWNSDFQPPGYEAPKDATFDLRRTAPYIVVHLGCVGLLWVGWSWFAVGAAVFLYLLRMFAITAFYHRYFSHRAYKTSRFMQWVFAVWGNLAMQRGALWWAATHRHHHQHSDEEDDKHSVRQHGFLWAHIGWLTASSNFPTDYKRIPDLAKYPELVWLNQHDFVIPVLYGAVLWFTGGMLETYAPGLGTNGPQLFIWGFFISTVFLMHGTLFINSLAHVWGRRRFNTTDDSKNSLVLSLITLGEGWHNNHHRYAHSARQGFYWWGIDVSYYLLKVFSWLGLVKDLRPVPAQVYAEVKAASATPAIMESLRGTEEHLVIPQDKESTKPTIR